MASPMPGVAAGRFDYRLFPASVVRALRIFDDAQRQAIL